MTATFTEDVPLWLIDGHPDLMLRVTFTYSPGRCACGPAYDHGGLPAEPPEIEVMEARILLGGGDASQPRVLTHAEDANVVDYLLENWEPPTGPDPDDERDRRRDDALTMGDE